MEIKKDSSKPKLSKKRKKKEKAYTLLNNFFKKSSADFKKLIEKKLSDDLTLALDLTGNIDVIEESLYNDLEPIKNLEGYRILHNVCKGLDKKISIEINCKTFKTNDGTNTSYVPKIKFDLTKPYEHASFDNIVINEYSEPKVSYQEQRRNKKKYSSKK